MDATVAWESVRSDESKSTDSAAPCCQGMEHLPVRTSTPKACIAALMHGRRFELDVYTEKLFSSADAASAPPRILMFKPL